MASIPVPKGNNMNKIVELAGGDTNRSLLSREILHVEDVSQEELDEAWTTYSSDLDLYLLQPLRDSKSEAITLLAHKYIEQSYPSFRRELFIALAEEARNNELTARVEYIDQLLAWIKTIVAAVLLAEDEINSCSTVEEIKSISLNTEVFSATDPKVTIRGAMAIEDTASDGPDFV